MPINCAKRLAERPIKTKLLVKEWIKCNLGLPVEGGIVIEEGRDDAGSRHVVATMRQHFANAC